MAANSQEALAELRAFQGSRRKSQDVLKESQTRLGLPSATQRQAGLRAAITNTENLIRNVDPSVSGRTQGSLVTEAQKQRLIGLERAPLSDQFREESRALEGETANIENLTRQALTDAQLAIAEEDRREEGLKGLYDTLYRREQDEIARQERERAAREAAAQSSALRNLLSGGGGGGGTVAPATNPVKQRAQADVASMLQRRGSKSFYEEVLAIAQSAGYGNTYDQAKLELLQSSMKGLFKNGKVNEQYLRRLIGMDSAGSASGGGW